MTISKTGYGSVRAANYDEESKFDKGNRDIQEVYLSDLLEVLEIENKNYLELGCGTGYFTNVFLRKYTAFKALLVDASPEMLKVAKKNLNYKNVEIDFMTNYIQQINWTKFQNQFDIIFSSLAVHHLTDDEKKEAYRNIHKNLSSNGAFILIDIFKPENETSNKIIEYLTCRDIQRRLKDKLQIDFEIEELKIENIIKKDREQRLLEGDLDSGLDWQLAYLKTIGFKSVTLFFVDTRHAGIVAIK